MTEVLSPHTETVISDWIDYNGHMNVAYYVLIFDHATDALLETAGLNATYREDHSGSVFVVESHIIYGREILEGAEVEVSTRVLNVDDKRLHLFHTMSESASKQNAATIEILLIHVDLHTRKASAFPEFLKTKLDALAKNQETRSLPAHMGRQIRF